MEKVEVREDKLFGEKCKYIFKKWWIHKKNKIIQAK